MQNLYYVLRLSMSELTQLQEQFQRFLLAGEPAIQAAIMPTEAVSVHTRLSIYQDAYVLRLIESLSANFPCLYAYLGTEKFHQLAKAYILAHPSSFRSIRWFGDVFGIFIKRYYAEYPYLAELADFEWNMTLAFDAEDSPVVCIRDMAQVPPEEWANLQFILHPSVQQRCYFWNVVSLWQALADNQNLPTPQFNSLATSWIVWRSPELMIQFSSLDEQEGWALGALAQGTSFAELCEGLCQWLPPEEVGMRAASYLKGWIQRGILSRFSTN